MRHKTRAHPCTLVVVQSAIPGPAPTFAPRNAPGRAEDVHTKQTSRSRTRNANLSSVVAATKSSSVPAGDFDFDAANAKFHREDQSKKDSDMNDSDDHIDEEVVYTKPKAKDSFFDDISCDSKDRQALTESDPR